jgi:hypothetical protein
VSAHDRIVPPEGHGEVLCDPPYAEWSGLILANRVSAERWPEGLRALREEARADVLKTADEYSRARGIAALEDGDDTRPIVMTGHQPELYHPGVWVKDFLLDLLASETDAAAVDLVVDTDRASALSLNIPRLGPPVDVQTVTLAPEAEGSFCQAPVPDESARAAFRAEGTEALFKLPAPALAHHFATFCDALDAAATMANDRADLMTIARRAYEAPVGSSYLELPVSQMARTSSFGHFAESIIADAARFRRVMNEALGAYRERTATRSAAQPFPDLEADGDLTELPFWLLRDGRRERVWVHTAGSLYTGEGDARERVRLPGGTGSVEGLLAQGWVLAPKALTLTLFARLFASDLFIHGTGGGRYDRVTDAVVRAYLGVEPPRYVVASMTLLLPLGGHVATTEELSELAQALHRLEHNPDAMLDEVEFDDDDECRAAHALAAEKAALVEAIGRPGADRKQLGMRIREVNASLAALLEPVAAGLRERLERARSAHDAAEVLMDRTYAYCLWDPREVMDKVRWPQHPSRG